MKIQDLEYFLGAAAAGHVGRAAATLGLTQPALTQSIARLEREIGAPLFERSPRGIRLNAAGEHLHRHALRMHNAMEDARREMTQFASGSAGRLRIGTGLAIAQYLLPAACASLLEQAPGLQLEITSGTGQNLMPMLRKGEIDLVLSGISTRPDDDMTQEDLAEDKVVVVAGEHHPLLRRRNVRAAELADSKWVLSKSGSLLTRWLAQRFTGLGLKPPTPSVETDSVSTLLALVANSSLLTFHSWSSIEHSPFHARLKPLSVPEIEWRRHIGAVYRTGAYLPPAAQALIEIVRTISRQENHSVTQVRAAGKLIKR